MSGERPPGKRGREGFLLRAAFSILRGATKMFRLCRSPDRIVVGEAAAPAGATTSRTPAFLLESQVSHTCRRAIARGLSFECERTGDWYMSRRFESFCALWLIAQILLPFTAPFPTCDLADFLGSAEHHSAPLVPSNSRADGDYAFAPPLATTSGRLKLVVVSSLDVSSVVGNAPAMANRRTIAAAGGRQRPAQGQPTVLRL